MRIVFVRHGEPDYANDCLTAVGKVQAEQAALRLREEGIEEIWSSPLGRAAETAKAANLSGITLRVRLNKNQRNSISSRRGLTSPYNTICMVNGCANSFPDTVSGNNLSR